MLGFSRGGVHPREEKITAKSALERFPAPEKLYVPVCQHQCAYAVPVVEKGAQIRKGQAIALPGGRVSASIHSPVSGKVSGIQDHLTYGGVRCAHIIIENDGKDEWAQDANAKRDVAVLTRDEIINLVASAGIVGMGGAAFPTHVKLVPPKPVDMLVINGAECEPYLTCDHRLMLEHPGEIVSGIALMLRATGATRAIIGIEENKPDAAKAMEDSIREQKLAGIKVALLKVRYPQGAEKQMIEAICQRKVPPRKLPFDVGVICQNVGTAYAIWNACKFGIPMIERCLTVSGDCVEKPGNLIVPIGTPISKILTARGLKHEAKRIIIGGPMMGVAIADLDQVVMKCTSGILAFKNLPNQKVWPCIRCGRCTEVCPMGLVPSQFALSVEGGDIAEYDNLGVPDCCECGCCAYVCPANRPLVQLAKKGKNELAARNK